MTKEQVLEKITLITVKDALRVMAADTVEEFAERVAIMAADDRLPLYQAEHDALQRIKRSWQN